MIVQFTTLFSFDGGFTGAYPQAGLTTDANGDLFGTTDQGGVNNYGTVFEIQNIGTVAAPVYASMPTTLASFNVSNGSYPQAGLTTDANGDLFGTTTLGGVNNCGMVFEIKNIGTVASPVYTGLTALVNFDGPDGFDPNAGVIANANGDLFGTTLYQNGANNYGTVFEIQNTGTVAAPIYSDTPTTLVSFNGSNGQSPNALIFDANGDLLGTTPSGGANNYGTVFEIQNTGTVAAPVYASAPITLGSFNGFNGQHPAAGLVTDANGNLFGTTGGG
jgi:hypothetical protein